jgi:hypothetical protein
MENAISQCRWDYWQCMKTAIVQKFDNGRVTLRGEMEQVSGRSSSAKGVAIIVTGARAGSIRNRCAAKGKRRADRSSGHDS